MDPLTHTLVGASLAATRLGEKTRLATPALVIGANLPDVDVLSYFRGGDFALGFRRGWTHGLPALIVLPLILALLLWLWGRRREGRQDDPPLDRRWLVTLSFVACLTHPALDWLNTYGMRWLMPFRDTWFYGDSVFIMDPYLWLVLGLAWAVGRRPSKISGGAAALMAAVVIWLVGSRAPGYLGIVGSVFLLLLVAFLWRPGSRWLARDRVATAGLGLGLGYILAMIALHSSTVSRIEAELRSTPLSAFEDLMVGPTPADPLAWDVVVETGDSYHWGRYDWRHGSLVMSRARLPRAESSPRWVEIVDSDPSKGFLRWVRFPWLEVEPDAAADRIYLLDARYTRGRSTGFGASVLELPAR